MSETTIRLKHPVDMGKDRPPVEEISIRRGRLGDLRGVQVGEPVPAETLMMIGSRMTGQPLGVIERLDEEDAGSVMAAVLGFIERCLTTGRTG